MSPVPPTKKSNRRFMVTALLALAAVLTAHEHFGTPEWPDWQPVLAHLRSHA
jgi:hypothetical protein